MSTTLTNLQETVHGSILGKKKGDLHTNVGNTMDSVSKAIVNKLLIEFGITRLVDLQLVNVGGHKNLYSKVLGKFKGVELAFQSTKKDGGGYITNHSHYGKGDMTDELIINTSENSIYGDTGTFTTNNGIIRIPSGATHGGNSNGTWISLKTKGYQFLGYDDQGGMIYVKSDIKIKIIKLVSNISYNISDLGFKDDILMIESLKNHINLRKNNKETILSGHDLIVIGEI